ncbi:U3 small nucleolar RNA-associated protein 21 [Grifola frondosa]|uniref:U3 small nucleolar RNA-associated protein 21 n=1 Tax=Grifola frondosa TaxID=5627 RepID=A0A1C7LZC0_GRIFR|nr:U3 small nucleolar RNA-associated protein 21 [Grifola frondosa]
MAATIVTESIEDRSTPPPRKRLRVEATNALQSTREPRLFAPFRALGLITNHVPFVLQTRSHKGATEGPRIHLLTCLGRAWAMWEGERWAYYLSVRPDAPELIHCMAMDGNAVWVSSGPHAIKYLRGKEVGRFTNPLETNLANLLVFGSQLLALTEDGGRMFIWDSTNGDLQGTIEFDPGFTATMILHPATYLNKVLVSSSQGSMQLWNTRTQTRIHSIPPKSLLTSSAQSSSSNGITALAQSPAIDVIGVGFSSGEISVYDVRADERLMRMFMQDGGVRSLSFRTGYPDGHPILASASSAGHIALWDLNSGGRLLHLMRGAHDGAVTSVEWVPGQPLLISSGEDNSVKQWLFDSPTDAPRLLKFRSGHHAPPHLIRYYGEDGKQLLTASRDRSLRCTSVVRDSRSFELSQGKICLVFPVFGSSVKLCIVSGSLAKKATSLSIPIASLKLPPVTSMSYSSTRAKDWDDILTAHADEAVAHTWTMKDKKLGKYTFKLAGERSKWATEGFVKAVCVSACGNFGIASSTSGVIHMYNMQSGILRKSFSVGPCPPEVTNKYRPSGTSKKKLEERCVTGLASDALNRLVVASTLDGTINFFDFHSANLEHTLILPSSAISITLHRDSGLLAVICDDLVVRIIDIETRRIVRELRGCSGRVLDLTFSPDSRWLVTTSMDSIIRTFDVPTGRLIDAFRTSSVATSVSFSPTNDFLATAHTDSVGVYLWANRAQYSEISFQSIVENDIVDVSLPSMQGVAEDEALEALSALTMQDQPADVFVTPPQLDGDLVTFTLLPRTRWQTLLNLEVIQQRNKPKEPPKQPEKAPFFLPTLPGVEPRFDVNAKKEDDAKSKKSTKRLQKATASSDSIFYTKLFEDGSHDGYESFFSYAKTLSPAAMDLELRSLVTLDALQTFLHVLTQRLRSHRDFEAVQTFQNVFLRMHGDVLAANLELLQDLETLQQVQHKESEQLLELLASSLGTLGFVRDTL